MTRWHDHPSSVRAQQKRQAKDHEQKVAANVRKLIFDVFARALEGAPFISKLEIVEEPGMGYVLMIHRHEDKFRLAVSAWGGRANVSVTRVAEDLYLPQYFGVQFYLARMGKVRRTALLLRKKLELFDVYQVTNS
jgi:hypothetical protein